MTILLDIHQEPPEKTSIQLSEFDGEEIRSLILSHSKIGWHAYLDKVELHSTNVGSYLSGRNRISLAVLHKLLSGTDLCLQCSLNVQIVKQDGVTANGADSMPVDDMLSLIDMEQSMPEHAESFPHVIGIPPSVEASTLLSSLSGKHQEPKRTIQDFPSKEFQDESSTPFSPTPVNPSTTVLPMSSLVDPQNSISEES